MKLKIRKVRRVRTPNYATDGSAGFDLYVPDGFKRTIIYPNNDLIISSGIQVAIPQGYMLKIANRSSVSSTVDAKKKAGMKVYDAPSALIVGADTIDSDFQGEIKIHVINYSNNLAFVNPGDKICQAILIPVISCDIEETEDELFSEPTTRGRKEFGSSNADTSSNTTIQEGHTT